MKYCYQFREKKNQHICPEFATSIEHNNMIFGHGFHENLMYMYIHVLDVP